MVTIYVYRSSQLVASFTRDNARDAWREAIRHLRYRHAWDTYPAYEGPCGGFWYQTANRVGYACGEYRATPMIAHR